MKEITLLVDDDVEMLGITCYTKDGAGLLVADDQFLIPAEEGPVHSLWYVEKKEE